MRRLYGALKHLPHDIIVALVLFVSCSYILALNPAILSPTGVPTGQIFAATALTAGLGSIAMGIFARAPSVVAPGMGLNAFVASFIVNTGTPSAVALAALCACYFAYILFVVAPGLRREFIDKLPPRIMQIISASIGAVILAAAISLAQPPCTALEANDPGGAGACHNCPIEFVSSLTSIVKAATSGSGWVFPVMAIVTLVLFAIARSVTEYLEAQGRIGAASAAGVMPGIVLLASVPATVWLVQTMQPGALATFDFAGDVSLRLIPFETLGEQALPPIWFPALAVFLMTVFFVLLTDIAGSPFLLLRDIGLPQQEYDRRVGRGFLSEALAGWAAVAMQASPAICFAESNAARSLRSVRGTPTVVCGVLFLVVLAFAMYGAATVHEFAGHLPRVALSPLLTTVGAMILLESPAAPSAGSGVLDRLQGGAGRLLAAGGAFVGGLTIGIAAGIVIEYVFAAARKQPAAREGLFITLTGLAFVSFFTMLWVMRCFH